jgi:hypothetical protein
MASAGATPRLRIFSRNSAYVAVMQESLLEQPPWDSLDEPMPGTMRAVGRQRYVVRNRAAQTLGVALVFAACGRSSKTPDASSEAVGGAPPAATGGTLSSSGTGGAGTGAIGGDSPASGTGGAAAAADGGAPADPGGLGMPCTVASDCESDLTCTLGACRTGCRTDADCPRGVLCSGTTPPYGCSLPAELECASAADCPTSLVCGPDGKCRVGCEVSDDCPRNDHGCRTGTCVGNDDPDRRWFECDDGETVCENHLTNTNCYEEGFPESCYRRMGCRLDGMNWGLVETCSPGYCVYEIVSDGPSKSWCQ